DYPTSHCSGGPSGNGTHLAARESGRWIFVEELETGGSIVERCLVKVIQAGGLRCDHFATIVATENAETVVGPEAALIGIEDRNERSPCVTVLLVHSDKLLERTKRQVYATAASSPLGLEEESPQ